MITDLLCVIVVVLVIVYDVIAFVGWGYQATITRVVRDNSRKHPIIPFALGVLAGHWFWCR